MSDILDKMLAEACLDPRIPDGIFDMSNNTHMEVLHEVMMDTAKVSLQDVRMIHNKMVEGKYPERQAYNKDGLLVTFPTPQHKQRAIQRGTHFEKDPTAGQQNVFGGQPPAAPGQAPAAPAAPQGQPPAAPAAPEAPQQNIFPPAAPAVPSGGEPSQLPPSATPAPQAPAGGQPSALPPSSAPAEPPKSPEQQNISTPPTEPPPPPKPPEKRAAEAAITKQIMGGDNTDPSMTAMFEKKVQLGKMLEYAIQMGYKEAAKTISEAMNR